MELITFLKLQWDRSVAIASAVLAVVMLLYGWWRVSGSPVVTEQMAYLVSAGLGGLFLLGIAATLWLSADFRDEWRALERLAEQRRAEALLEDRLSQLEARLGEPAASAARRRAPLRAEEQSPNGAPAPTPTGR